MYAHIHILYVHWYIDFLSGTLAQGGRARSSLFGGGGSKCARDFSQWNDCPPAPWRGMPSIFPEFLASRPIFRHSPFSRKASGHLLDHWDAGMSEKPTGCYDYYDYYYYYYYHSCCSMGPGVRKGGEPGPNCCT